jgi:transcriptional regulator with XRE-family HTH domain
MHETMPQTTYGSTHETTDTLTVAARLRRARLAAGLELRDIEQRTRISPSILRWIDEGQFHRLPAGIYARSYIRAVAHAVGLDPNEIVSSIEHELPAVAEAVRPSEIVPEPTRRFSPEWLRVAAAAVDATALSIVYGIVLGITGGVCGRSVAEVIAPGLPAMVVVLAVLTALYFLIFAGIEGRTPGARVFGLPRLDVSGPVRLQEVVTRAFQVFASEASVGLEIASRRSAPREVSAAAPYGSRSTP